MSPFTASGARAAGRGRVPAWRWPAVAVLVLVLGACSGGWPRVHVSGAGDDIEDWHIGFPF